MTRKTEVTADGTVEKGLGPANALVQAGSPYGFQPLTMKILGKEEDKAKWQDRERLAEGLPAAHGDGNELPNI